MIPFSFKFLFFEGGLGWGLTLGKVGEPGLAGGLSLFLFFVWGVQRQGWSKMSKEGSLGLKKKNQRELFGYLAQVVTLNNLFRFKKREYLQCNKKGNIGTPSAG